MTVAYIAIGSNLASPLEQVNAALKALGDIPESRILAVSSFYRTPTQSHTTYRIAARSRP